jgi:hypothetical protein
MALDLFLGIIPKSWARGTSIAQTQPVVDEPTVACTPEEKAKLEKFALIKMRAESGDKKAQKQWKTMLAGLPSLKTKAKRGDPKAKRTLLILSQGGFLQRAQVFADLSGDTAAPIESHKPWTDSDPSIKVGPHKSWADSDPSVKAGPRKPWTDSDPNVKVSPRKPWTDEIDKTAGRKESMIGSSHYIEIEGDFAGDEKRAQDEDGGCSSMGDSLSHNKYRALVIKQAMKNAGGAKPTTRHFFAAKSSVDKALGNAGVAIYIPGAKPGRRTV